VPLDEAVEAVRKEISDLEEELRHGIPAAEGKG
jgi:hypothetical protein